MRPSTFFNRNNTCIMQMTTFVLRRLKENVMVLANYLEHLNSSK